MKEFDYKHSDDKLKHKFEGFEMTPPENTWSGIVEGLPKRDRRKRFFFWIPLLLLFIGGAATTYVFTTGSRVHENNHTVNKHHHSNNASQSSSKKHLASNTSATTNDKTLENNEVSTINLAVPNSTNYSSTPANKDDILNKNRSPKDDQTENSLPLKKSSDSKNKGELSKKTSNVIADDTNMVDNSNEESTETNLNDSMTDNSIAPSENSTIDKGVDANTSSPISRTSDSNTEMESLVALELENLPYQPKGQGDFTSEKFKTPRIGSWSGEIGVGISTFRYSPKVSAGNNLQTYIKDAQTNKLGRDFYAHLNYHISPLISVHSGAEFQQNSYNVNYQTSSTSTSIVYDTIGWYVDTTTQQQYPILDSSTVTETTTQDYIINNSESIVNIPFGVRLHLPLGVRSQLGISATGLIGIRTAASGSILKNENNELVDLNNGYRKSGNLSMRLSVRYLYMLNENFAVYVEPWYGFGLNNRSTNELPYQTNFSNTGFNIGIRRNF